MNRNKVEKFIEDKLANDFNEWQIETDERMEAFDNLKVGVYPQSFGRVSIRITSAYGYKTADGITRYTQVEEVVDSFIRNALFNYYADFFRNHKKGGQK